ncbi:MAG TPA: SDR family oxidoreductase [Thermoplasmata archaeon]|nr:SDR family oxidoreductase [Thermoplasmata archaeon]
MDGPSNLDRNGPRSHGPIERVALITGASRGLGYTLAEFLARQRWSLIVTARHERPLSEAADRLRAAGAIVTAVPGDVARPRDRRSIAAAVRQVGRLDLLVNNASELGASPLPPLLEHTLPALRRVFEVNVLAPIALVRACLPLLASSRGLVVNVTSDAAGGGYPGWGGYGSSKAALELVSKTLANELRDAGVGVVAVDPGDLRTQMHQDAFPGQDIRDRPLPEVTLPFWAWLEGQDPARVTGQRFEAQGAVWEVPA